MTLGAWVCDANTIVGVWVRDVNTIVGDWVRGAITFGVSVKFLLYRMEYLHVRGVTFIVRVCETSVFVR